MPGIGDIVQNAWGAGIEALQRPKYAVGNLIAGQPAQAVRALTAIRPLREEEKVTPGAALGLPPGAVKRIADIALDPVIWGGLYGISKIKAGKGFGDWLTNQQRVKVRESMIWEAASDLKRASAVQGQPLTNATRMRLETAFNQMGTTLREPFWQDQLGIRPHQLSEQGAASIIDKIEGIAKKVPPPARDPGWATLFFGSGRSNFRGTSFQQTIEEGERLTRRWAHGMDDFATTKWATFRIKPDRYQTVFDYNETPLANRAAFAHSRKMSAKEVAAAKWVRSVYRTVGSRVHLAQEASLAQGFHIPKKKLLTRSRMETMDQRGYNLHVLNANAPHGEIPIDLMNSTPNPNQWVPFLERRIDAPHLKDPIQALRTYIRYAARSAYFEPAMFAAEKSMVAMPEGMRQQAKLVLNRMRGVRPAELSALASDLRALGWKSATARDAERVLGKMTSVTWTGALGFNISSSLRNLTQQLNTLAELGGRWWKEGIRAYKTPEGKALVEKSGIFSEFPMLEKELAGTPHSVWQRIQNVMMKPFNYVERVNRSVAYLGARQRAMFEGASRVDAARYAADIVEKTQFGYTPATRPIRLMGVPAGGPSGRLFGQFTTFPVKQTEMISAWVKDRDWAKLARYLTATSWTVYAAREALGVDVQNTFGTGIYPAGLAPIPAMAYDLVRGDVDAVKRRLPILIPAGIQGSRVKRFVESAQQGWKVYDRRGRLMYEQSVADAVRRLIGFRPETARQASEQIDRARSLHKAYQTARQEAIAAATAGAVSESERIIQEFTARTGVPIHITPAAVRSAMQAADKPLIQRVEDSLPKDLRAVLRASVVDSRRERNRGNAP